MEIYEPISGLKVITPDRFGDHRGFFGEVWNLRRYEKLGIDIEYVQDNISFSAQAGTVRGLHFQAPPHAQAGTKQLSFSGHQPTAFSIR
ncbi:dTDP-4-dehydrorhamnose 3,5-epimerase family protein [Sphingopyxis sp.]|uniref:dTDP-4-dehydrorhamnose 3,5-epimerase family protein n=1 Tax=Sphingopyxis sp. TaxID=1908224 RepID=UPI003D6C980C